MRRTIRLGIVGAVRGLVFARLGPLVGMEATVVCESRPEALARAARLGIPTTTEYDDLLERDVDAVVLANYFHQHAPLAIRALAAGKHVLSETTAAKTLAEAVALVRAVEASGKVYMLAENYPYMAANQEMRRLYQTGTIGELRYGEGEYVHPMSAEFFNAIAPGEEHWRHWIPSTYYCTHSLAPVMYVTGTRPVRVSGLVIPHDPDDAVKARTRRRVDTASMIALRMDNGAVVKLLQWDLRGEGNWVRIHGNRGLMENLRHGDQRRLRVRTEPWEKGPGEPVERIYTPRFPFRHRTALKTGHGGSDFFVCHHFAEAIRTGEQPHFDVYRAVTMTAVGILAFRSALAGSAPFDVPDLGREAHRRACEADDWSPDPADRRPGQPWPSVLGDLRQPAQPGP